MDGLLGSKSSKRVQCGEPICIVFIPLSAEPAKRAKSFVFRFESLLAHSASARRKPERSVWPSRQFTGVFRSSLKSTVSSLGMPVSG